MDNGKVPDKNSCVGIVMIAGFNMGKAKNITAKPIMPKRMLNFYELGHYIGLSPQTVKNKFYCGEFPIPAKKIFSKTLWDIKDVDKYLDKLTKIDC